ncbi:hypothetical protein ACTFIU_011154 [Dictyostelium citrinum]
MQYGLKVMRDTSSIPIGDGNLIYNSKDLEKTYCVKVRCAQQAFVNHSGFQRWVSEAAARVDLTLLRCQNRAPGDLRMATDVMTLVIDNFDEETLVDRSESVIQTDLPTILHIQKIKDPPKRLIKALELISKFKFSIIYIPSENNIISRDSNFVREDVVLKDKIRLVLKEAYSTNYAGNLG